MMKDPLVSILMTVFNREKYLSAAIESVLNSTYETWELIIVDDGSADRSVEIARNYEKTDPRIHVYINEKNLGDYANRNQAGRYAQGKYLKYVDADDMIYPYGLEQLVFYMEQFPEAGFGLCSLEQDPERMFPFQLDPGEAHRYHYFNRSIFHKAPLSSIIRKEAFDKTGGFTGKRMVGDFEMWHLLSREFPVVLMPHGIVWYRVHEDQEMALHRNDPMEPFRYLLIQKELLDNPACPLNPADRKKAIQETVRREARTILSAFRRYPYKKARELLDTSELSIGQVLKWGTFYKWK